MARRIRWLKVVNQYTLAWGPWPPTMTEVQFVALNRGTEASFQPCLVSAIISEPNTVFAKSVCNNGRSPHPSRVNEIGDDGCDCQGRRCQWRRSQFYRNDLCKAVSEAAGYIQFPCRSFSTHISLGHAILSHHWSWLTLWTSCYSAARRTSQFLTSSLPRSVKSHLHHSDRRSTPWAASFHSHERRSTSRVGRMSSNSQIQSSKFIWASLASVVFDSSDHDGVDETYPYPPYPMDKYSESKAARACCKWTETVKHLLGYVGRPRYYVRLSLAGSYCSPHDRLTVS